MSTDPWITVIGVGDDGLDGLAPKTRALLDAAEVLVGGDRHQAMVPNFSGDRVTWAGGLAVALETIATHRGKNLVVLATGDPMCFGAGTNLQKKFPAEELRVIPHVSAFSHAAARMRWSLPDTDCLTLHGRPIETLHSYIQPGVRLIALSWDGETPMKAAAMLAARGFGDSVLTVFEHMGGDRENRISRRAKDWGDHPVAMLNTVCIDCVAGADADVVPRISGLPEATFDHDRLITKREVRAITVSRLMPGPDQVLWDVGAGCGSVSVEWMRAARGARAIAIEKNDQRRAMIQTNAKALGVPLLDIIAGDAPACFGDIKTKPDAIFVGGGVSAPGLLQACFDKLGRGGRLVANGVTIEAEQELIAIRKKLGGGLTRIAIARDDAVGASTELTGFKPMMAVTQWSITKPW